MHAESAKQRSQPIAPLDTMLAIFSNSFGVQCDNRRPVCFVCARRGTSCHFSPPSTRSEVRRLVEVIRNKPENESAAIFDSIRTASSVDDVVQTFADTNWAQSDAPRRFGWSTQSILYVTGATHMTDSCLSFEQTPLYGPQRLLINSPYQ
jgi:hypothetical protein